ncbi:hypothetical protein RF11_07629 [Thelohanellus kitauei]|uniref:Uncharacterized protein n=1 Tax=Thelohanellus kitauei TaxID=669202 RepID=A0A0C2NFS3_THEKT|nr:hypothetical protein RF11_07629 [Thelohanellus kitauei]
MLIQLQVDTGYIGLGSRQRTSKTGNEDVVQDSDDDAISTSGQTPTLPSVNPITADGGYSDLSQTSSQKSTSYSRMEEIHQILKDMRLEDHRMMYRLQDMQHRRQGSLD